MGRRLGARAIDLGIEVAVGILLFALLTAADRPFAGWFVAAVAISAYESAMVAWFGGTVGKLILGLRVAELDRPGRPSWGAAARRGVAYGCLVVLLGVPVIGLLVSVALSPLRRAVLDRLANTFVVSSSTPLPVRSTDLPALADLEEAPTRTPWGFAAAPALRRRARLHRLDDAPWLVAGIVLLALAASLAGTTLDDSATAAILISSALWLPLFAVDETWRIARLGATAGHRQAGLVVVDQRTGETPSTGRSFVRAALLATTLYLAPALLFGAVAAADGSPGAALALAVAGAALLLVAIADVIVLQVTDDNRALHDLVSGTVVIADPRLDPAVARARALSLTAITAK